MMRPMIRDLAAIVTARKRRLAILTALSASLVLSVTACNQLQDKTYVQCLHCAAMLSPSAKACPKCGEPTTIADVVVNSLGMKLKPLTAGRFRMGAADNESDAGEEEKPVHNVDISEPFMIGVTEVTQGEFEAVMGTNPSAFTSHGSQKEQVHGLETRSFPVESVTWEDAVEFCDRLSERPEERAQGRTYRLPTEAEWEFAATRGSFGATATQRGPGSGVVGRQPSPVNNGLANSAGLVGMADNVSEWTADWFSSDYYVISTGRDPKGPKEGSVKSFRGAAWNSTHSGLRFTARDADIPEARRDDLGFRVVCVKLTAGVPPRQVPERKESEVANRPPPSSPSTTRDLSASLAAWKRAVVRLSVRTPEGESQGSGFVIDSHGTVVTNCHVIEDAVEVSAFFSDGFQEPIHGVVGFMPDKDLAFLRLASGTSRCEPLALADSLPREGRPVYAMGCPLGLGFSLTQGIVSGIRSAAELRDAFRSEGSPGPNLNVQWIQTTAAVNWGNSGGPLIDDGGRVVGVNTLVFGRNREGGTAEGLNFAVSSQDVLQAKRQMDGSVRSFPVNK
jgi:formylglycine-generating enzyme required for sulfatase activity/S1-C subfamily serine protease